MAAADVDAEVLRPGLRDGHRFRQLGERGFESRQLLAEFLERFAKLRLEGCFDSFRRSKRPLISVEDLAELLLRLIRQLRCVLALWRRLQLLPGFIRIRKRSAVSRG